MITVGHLTPQDVQRFLNRRTWEGLSPRTVRYIGQFLTLHSGKHCDGATSSVTWVPSQPPPRLKPKQTETLSASDATALMAFMADARLGLLFTTALYAG